MDKFAKALPVVRLANRKLPVSVDAVVGFELLAKTLADKHMATVLPNFVHFGQSRNQDWNEDFLNLSLNIESLKS